MGELDAMTAVVTGTAQGIGRGVAGRPAANGPAVHEVDKDTIDLSDSAATENFFAQVGDVDILVNVAGGVVGQTHIPIDELTDEAWNAVIAAHRTTPMSSAHRAAR